MKLRELLERKEFKYKEVITIGPNDTISAAINKMIVHDRGSLPVCEETGELVGIVTERDIARKCAINENCAIIKIQDVIDYIKPAKKIVETGITDEMSYAE